MTIRTTVTTGAVTAALLLTGATAALADEPAGTEGTAPTQNETPTAPEATTEAGPQDTEAPAPADPVVAPAPEASGAQTSEEPSTDETIVEQPADETVAPEATDDQAPAVDETEATDEAAATEAPAEGVDASAPGAALFGASALAAAAQYPSPDYQPHWHDGGEDGLSCDYWHFSDPIDGGSGKDWSGWGSPQLHILHHTLVDDDGTVHMVYDRDIAGSWYHVWDHDEENPERVSPDPDGIHWSNTGAQQTVLVNGYRGGNDWDAKLADALATFERAGVTVAIPEWYNEEPVRQEWMSDADWEYEQSWRLEQKARFLDYTAYTATQFAVWYYSTGHDVMGMFFDVDANGHVTLSAKAERLLTPLPDDFDWNSVDWDDPEQVAFYNEAGQWSYGSQSDRRAVLETAAWLIEQGLNDNAVMPQPGFVSNGYVARPDGSTDYGFTVSLVAGTGNVGVELRTADGSAIPAGVILVDAQGNPVTSVAPGQRVYVRVPAGMDASTLPAFQLWGSAQGTQKGSPHFYTGTAHTGNDMYDPETGEMIEVSKQHWLIGLGQLDQQSTAWNWVGITLADQTPATPDPEGPAVDPATPTDPIVAPAPGTDPTNLADPGQTIVVDASTGARPAGRHAAPATSAHLATTGSEAGNLAALAGIVVLAGTGLVLARRRGRHAAEA